MFLRLGVALFTVLDRGLDWLDDLCRSEWAYRAEKSPLDEEMDQP